MPKSFIQSFFKSETSEFGTQTEKLPESEWEYIQLANDLKEQFQQKEQELREQQEDFIPDLENMRIQVPNMGNYTIPALVGAFQVERERADEIQRAYEEVRDEQEDAVWELKQLQEEHRQLQKLHEELVSETRPVMKRNYVNDPEIAKKMFGIKSPRPVIKIMKKDLFLASQVRSLTNNNNNK